MRISAPQRKALVALRDRGPGAYRLARHDLRHRLVERGLVSEAPDADLIGRGGYGTIPSLTEAGRAALG